jgi:hypothetical protein
MRKHNGGIGRIAGALSLLVISLLYYHVSGGNVDTVSPKFAHLFDKTKTVCIGRFLIDVPATAQVIYGPADVALTIERYPGEVLKEALDKRLEEIDRDRIYAFGPLREKDSLVGTVRDGVVPGQKIAFGVQMGSDSYYRIESYLKLGDDLFVQSAMAYGTREEYEKSVATLNLVASLLRSRAEDEIPDAPGVCIDGGFVVGPSEFEYENLRLGIRLAEYPDVHFSLLTSKKPIFYESDALEPRLQQAEEMARRMGLGAWYSRIKTLRRGQRQIRQWQGFEILARKPSQAGKGESHEFAFLSQGEPKNSLLPVLDLKLDSGVVNNKPGSVVPSVSDEEAVELWDKLTTSIRVRVASPSK